MSRRAMKNISASLFFVFLLLAGCVQQTIYVDDTSNTTNETTPQVGEKEVLPQPIEEPIVRFDQPVKDLVAKGTARPIDYSYLVIDKSRGNSHFKVYALNDKLFIIPPREQVKGFVNRVYVDKTNKTALGFCRNVDGLACEKFGPFNLSFDEWNLPTPHEYLAGINNAKYIAESSFDRRPVAVFDEIRNGATFQVYIDTFYGLPLQVSAGKEDIPLQFTSMGFSHVASSMVEPDYSRIERLD